MKFHEWFPLRNLAYLRATIQPGFQPPIPSAWVVAAHEDLPKGQNTIYWVDLSRYWGDGISSLYLQRRYRNTITIAPNFGPLRKLPKLTTEQRASYWHRHAEAKSRWHESSASLSLHLGNVAATWYERLFGPRFAHDVMLRSETRIRPILGPGRSSTFNYRIWLREGIFCPDVPNAIQADDCGDDGCEIVAFAEIDPAWQTTLDKWCQRVWYLDHSVCPREIYVEGWDAPRRGGNIVDVASIREGVPSIPWTGSPKPPGCTTYSQLIAHRDRFNETKSTSCPAR